MKLAVDLVIRRGDEFLFVVRKYEPFAGYLALPGGFVEEDESVEDAAIRELAEETDLHVTPDRLTMIGVFSKPDRDPRGRVVSVAYAAKVHPNATAVAGDDAKQTVWLSWEEAIIKPLAFDHREILNALPQN